MRGAVRGERQGQRQRETDETVRPKKASMRDRRERQRKRERQPPKWGGRKTKMKETRDNEIGTETVR